MSSSRDCAAYFAAFVREVTFAFSLKHPNIVRTLGGVVDPEEEPPCWIVMERLDVSLAEVHYA
jgi:serine/threonine protein kinase